MLRTGRFFHLFVKNPSRFVANSHMSSFSTATKSIPSLIEVGDALSLIRANNNIKFIDGSWHMNKERKPLDEFINERIIGSTYFNIDEVCDKNTTLPHMIPSESEFSEHVGNAGIKNTDHVIVYGTEGAFSPARVWWMFRLFGHDNVSILNGGLPGWKAASGPIESGAVATPVRTEFKAVLNKNMVITCDDVLSIVNSGAAQIIDARSHARFNGETPEPRPGLRGGHIPGALCLPFTSILREDDVTKFRPLMEIKNNIQDSGAILGANMVMSCGSGVTAAVLYFALHLMGTDINKLALYDGSWTEWALREDLPVINPAQDDL